MPIVSVAAVAAVILAGCSSTPSGTKKHHYATGITTYTASPLVLPDIGGKVKVSADVVSAITCTVGVSPKIPHHAVKQACTSGKFSETLTLPPNEGAGIQRYRLVISVKGKTDTVSSLPITIQLATPPPVVSSLTADPSSLGSSGGSVTIRATVLHFRRCHLTVRPRLKSFPSGIGCDKAGQLKATVALPANSHRLPTHYEFRLAAVGGTAIAPKPIPIGTATTSPGKKKKKGSSATTTTTAAGSSSTSSTAPATTSTTAPASTSTTAVGTSSTTSTTSPGHKGNKSHAKRDVLKTIKTITVSVGALSTPTITSFTATPASIPASSTSVVLAAQLSGAVPTAICVFSVHSGFKIAGLPATVPCATGSASVTVTVPANSSTKSRPIKFKFAVHLKGLHTSPREDTATASQAGVPKSSSTTTSTTALRSSATAHPAVVAAPLLTEVSWLDLRLGLGSWVLAERALDRRGLIAC